MKVLMFGWEYPLHVFGGLATANFGITQGLHAQGDVDITLCLPQIYMHCGPHRRKDEAGTV